MKISSQSFAGLGTSATRVVEMYVSENQRLFDDPYALKLLPFWWRVILRFLYLPGLRGAILALRERRMPGTLGAILCRTRCIDDVLRKSLNEGIQQVVILGAGFDTRAYRITGIDRVRVFEIDLPGTQKLKKKRVAEVFGAIPENVIILGMDFEHQVLGDVLKSAGYQAHLKTLFIWEGVTQYISGEAVSSTLLFVSGNTAPGSMIVFTYVREQIVDGSDRPEWLVPFLSFAERVGSPFIFGLDRTEIAQYLADRGLNLISDVGAKEHRERYILPTGRDLNVVDFERVVLAEVVNDAAT